MKQKPNYNKIKAFIFDLDGTLIDTEKIYRKVWPETVNEMGFDFKDEQYLELRSLGRPFAPKRFLEWYGPSFDYNEARKIRNRRFSEAVSRDGISPRPGVSELLAFLRSKGITIAIATATDPVRATEYLKTSGLEPEAFDRIISATEVAEGKPSPLIYQYACECLQLSPSQVIAVEDAPNGIVSAFRAGCNVIMVPDQSEPDAELSNMLTACVRSLADIPALFA